MTRPRILIVSASYIVRKGLQELFEEKDFEVIFSDDGDLPQPVTADLILLDPVLANPEDLEKQMEDIPVFERPRIVLLLWQDTQNTSHYPYVLKLCSPKAELLQDIEQLTRFRSHFVKEESSEDPLSSREKAILRLVALGKTNKEIAEQLFISTHTVITHRKNITKKLGIKTVSGLTVYAILNKIIHLEDV